jgi:hypothetical protein
LCLVASSPLEPAGGVAGRVRACEGGGEQASDFADGKRDEAGVGGRPVGWPGRRPGRGSGGVPELAAVTAQIAKAAMTSTMWRSNRSNVGYCAFCRPQDQEAPIR